VWEVEGGLELGGGALFEAGQIRSAWYQALIDLFERFDYLALPTAQVFPFSVELDWPKEIAGRTMDTYHRWMEVCVGPTMAGLPVVTLPAGFDDQGRPMGIQFIGPPHGDEGALELALAYVQTTDYLDRRPTLIDKL